MIDHPEISTIQTVVLAIVQGITEFLPISSSAHLILVPEIVGWPDQGLDFDVAMHIGTLFAVMAYFWRDTLRLVIGCRDAVKMQPTDDARLLGLVALGTLPVVIVGLLLKNQIEGSLRTPTVITFTTIVFALVLWLADRKSATCERRIAKMWWRDALLIGAGQVLALVPGVSRSGITITAALFLGFKREDAARFSLLLSMPTTAAAGILAIADLLQSGTGIQSQMLWAALMSFASALIAITLMMRFLKYVSFTPYVIYRLMLGGVLIWLITSGGI